MHFITSRLWFVALLGVALLACACSSDSEGTDPTVSKTINFYKTMLALNLTDMEEAAHFHSQLASVYQDAGDMENWRLHFDKGVELDRAATNQSPEVHMARVRSKAGTLVPVIGVCDQFLAQDSMFAPALYEKARAFMLSGDPDQAKVFADRALAADPGNLDAQALSEFIAEGGGRH